MTYAQLYMFVYYSFLIHTQIIAKKPFPDSLRSNAAAYVGCISGAILLQDYQTLMQDAGFEGELALEDMMSLVTKSVYWQTSYSPRTQATSMSTLVVAQLDVVHQQLQGKLLLPTSEI